MPGRRTAARFVELSLARRRLVLAAGLLIAVACVPGALRLEIKNSPETFFLRGSWSHDTYLTFTRLFGPDEGLRIEARGEGLWTPAGLTYLAELEDGIARLPGVRAVFGLRARHERRLGAWPPADPSLLRELSASDVLDRNLGLIGRDGVSASVLVDLVRAPAEVRRRHLLEIERSLGPPPPGVKVVVAGMPLLDRALDRAARRVQQTFFPAIVAVAVALMAVLFRRWRRVAIPLCLVGIAELAVLGALGYLGLSLDLVLVVVPPLVFVIGLATALHVMLRFDEHARQTDADAVELARIAFRDKGSAVLWMGVTTAAAFGSLAVSRVSSVRAFGIWASFGMAVLTLAALTFYPALLATFGRRHAPVSRAAGRRTDRRASRGRLAHIGRAWAEAAARRRALVLGAAGLVALLGIVGAARLSTESNALRYLSAQHPVRVAIETLERDGIGVSTVEIMVRHRVRRTPGDGEMGTGRPRFDDPSALGGWRALSSRVRPHRDVIGAVGPADLVAGLAPALFEARSAGEGAWRLAVAALRNDPAGRDAIAKLVTEDGQAGRLTVFVPTAGLATLGPLMERLERDAADVFPDADVAITGRLPLLLATQGYLLRTLLVSFSLTLVIVALVFRLLLRSNRVTALAMIPNVWPVLGVLGIMGFSGTPLDVGTVMVASIVLGLAVDDTIHTLEHFRELAPRVGRLEAVAGTLEITAPAYVITGAVLIGGFGVLSLSPFLPTARFGMLCAVGIALAVVSDLFLLPALLGSVGTRLIDRLDGSQSKSRGEGQSAPSSSSR